MAINQLSNSNTFQHWLIATQQLIAFANSITDAGANSEFVINSALTVTGTLNAQSGIVTTNISTTNLVANSVITTNVISTSLNTQLATINTANINLANVNVANFNTIVFSDGTTLNSNSFIIELSTLGNAAFDKANAANVLAQAAYNQANNTGTILIGSFDTANAAFNKANAANVLAQAAFNKANSAADINAVDNTTTSTLYPIMVGAAGVDSTPNVTTTKYEFDAFTGRLKLTGPYATKGASGGVELFDRSGGASARYSVYSNNNNFYVYDNTATQNKITLLSSGYVGIGVDKTTPTANLDWNQTVYVVSTAGPISANPSSTYILTVNTTLNLPSSPKVGTWIKIINRGTNLSSVIGRNGSPIMGLNEDMTVNIANIPFTLVYAESPVGWVIT